MTKERNFGLDMIRSLAIILVICVHGFFNLLFDTMSFKGFSIFIVSGLRWFSYICVPLFMLLTGYLNTKKKPTKEYYKKIIPILGSYAFISIITIVIRKLYLQDPLRWSELILKIFNFTAIEYGWYVEMYIGLFLLIPFLNILYQNIIKRKDKHILFLVLAFLCCFEATINGLKVDYIRLDIFPDWWSNLYPVFYYFIGSYIKEYQPKISKSVLCTGLFFVLLFQTLLGYFYYTSIGTFDRTVFDGFNSLPTVCMAVIVFLLLYQIPSPKKWIGKIVASISILSFDMYLFSFIIDMILYGKYRHLASSPFRLLLSMGLFVPVVFLLSYLLSGMKYLLATFIRKIRKT